LEVLNSLVILVKLFLILLICELIKLDYFDYLVIFLSIYLIDLEYNNA